MDLDPAQPAMKSGTHALIRALLLVLAIALVHMADAMAVDAVAMARGRTHALSRAVFLAADAVAVAQRAAPNGPNA